MPFYRKENDDLLVAPNFVIAPGYELHAESRADHTYPVDGWYWFDSLDDALRGLPSESSVLTVTRAQGKAALIQAGLWDSVIAYVASIADPVERALSEVALNDTTEWERTSPFLVAAAAAMGLTDEALDGLFTQARSIRL